MFHVGNGVLLTKPVAIVSRSRARSHPRVIKESALLAPAGTRPRARRDERIELPRGRDSWEAARRVGSIPAMRRAFGRSRRRSSLVATCRLAPACDRSTDSSLAARVPDRFGSWTDGDFAPGIDCLPEFRLCPLRASDTRDVQLGNMRFD